MRQRLLATACCALGVLSAVLPVHADDGAASQTPAAPATAPGLGDPGKLIRIAIETGRTVDGQVAIVGRDAGQQMVVLGHYDSGQLRDLTRDAVYSVEPAGVVQVDATGHIAPIAEGTATIQARIEGTADDTIQVAVAGIQHDPPVSFPNQVVPVFTKFGCNGGGCHGKASGQNGFRLSLLGFEPAEDYVFLVKEGRGRRLFPSVPDHSLLLLKATGKSPHGGGQRLPIDSPSYRLLRRWIEQGMPYGEPSAPVVTRLDVHPAAQLMNRDSTQQLVAVAHYSDGSTEDVTRTTQFNSNDVEMAEVSETGLVTTGLLTGTVSVMARYQGQVAVFRATVPLGLPVDGLPPARNLLDQLVFANLQALGLPPSPLCDDATFLRRVTVDLAGRLPSLDEVAGFLADTTPDKRDRWIDRLLDSSDYAEYFANKWSAVLRNKRRQETDRVATYAFHDWIRASLYENKSYDQFVGEIITAVGQPGDNPPAAWYREVADASAQVEDVAQLFLGMRIQCARCHHHPFEKWSQQDYYGFSAFFSRVGRKKGLLPGQDRIVHSPGLAIAKHPKTGQDVVPMGLGSQPATIAAEQDPRQELARWMADPANPYFAPALVNRYWKHFFGRGLVDPEDDMRVTNPAANPALLHGLARDFVEHQFDLKHLVRTICRSATYQLAAEPNAWNKDDKQNFSRHYPQRLNAEVLLDAINQVTAATANFDGMLHGTRAIQLPDNGFNSYFLTVFGRPESSSACECERSADANLAQSLHLLNSAEIQDKLTSAGSRATQLAAAQDRDHAARLRELYLLAFARPPRPDELQVAEAHLAKCGDDAKRGYEDLVWAVINTKEFLFNH